MFDNGKLNFPFPLFTTAFHMLVQFSLSLIVLYFFPHFRPENGGAHGHGHASDMGRSRHEAEPADKTPMTRWFYWTRIGPCGAATGLDIGLGNTSLKFITLTFYSMLNAQPIPPEVLLICLVGREIGVNSLRAKLTSVSKR